MTVFLHRSIYTIMTFFIGLFVASSFFIRAKYNYFVYGDTPVLEQQQLGMFILVGAGLLLLSIALYRLSLSLNKFSPKWVISITLFVSFALQIAIVFWFPRIPTDDSQTVVQLAVNMLYRNDYSSFETNGYLYMFPFNYSIVLYIKKLLTWFPDNYLVIKAFNMLFTLFTTLMIYFIYMEIKNTPEKNDYGVLFFAATYIPALFMINLIYNDVIATAFLTGAIYFTISFVKKPSIIHIITTSIFLAIGNYFRSIGVIVLIAAVIYVLLSMKRIGIKKVIAALCILALLFNLPGWTQNQVLQSSHITEESPNKNSAPVYMWLHMGINLKTFGFWDNRQSYSIYQNEARYNKDQSKVLFKEAISKKLSDATFYDLLKMYYKKIIWTWTEGTYQLDRYGIGNEGRFRTGSRVVGPILGGFSYSTFATDLFKGDSNTRNSLLWIVYVMSFLMYVFILIRLIGGIKAKRFDEVFLNLVILGFIGFYLLWEIKSRYIFPVYPLFIVLSYLGFKDVIGFVAKRNSVSKEA